MIVIKEFDPAFQKAIDVMMSRIQQEFREQITTSHSTVIKDVYQKPGQKYWVAVDGETVAGTIGIVLFPEKNAEVKRMMVDPDYRGAELNAASLLLETGLRWAAEHEVKTVYLGTMEQFMAAQKFYEKKGFEKVAQFNLPSTYKINPMDTIFYKIQLPH
jgi:N-acetylglutamate synthase-like GNAT family acetyltransferase